MNKIIDFKSTSAMIAIALLLGTILTGCATIKTGSHQDESASFSSYQTFAWIADNPLILGDGEASSVSPLSRKKITDAIESELRAKGFRYSTDRDRADFVLSYTVGTREKIEARSYPSGYRGTWGWHMYGSYYYMTEVDHRTYTEGTLGIDIFDGNSKQPVWHGWASKTISTSDRKNPSPAIREAVAEIFKHFPSAN